MEDSQPSTVPNKMETGDNFSAEPDDTDTQLSPVENPLIVNLLLQYCTSISELKIFRQVCKLWHHLSLGTWRNQAKLTLRFRREREVKFINTCRTDQDPNFEQFTALFETDSDPDLPSFHQLQQKPFSNIQVSSLFINHPRMATASLRFSRAWGQISGPHLTSLWLKNSYVKSTSSFSFSRMIFVDCPNLRKLVLDKVTLFYVSDHPPSGIVYGPAHANLKFLEVIPYESGHASYFSLDWTEFLRNLPNLEEIRFSNQTCTIFTSFVRAIHALRREDPKRLKLKRLYLFDETTPTAKKIPGKLLQILEGTPNLEPLELEELYIELHIHEAPDHRVTSLRMESLRRLHLFQISRMPDADFQLPNLPNLLELVLEGDFITNLDFLRSLPLLQSLELRCDKRMMVQWGYFSMRNPRRYLFQTFDDFQISHRQPIVQLKMMQLTQLKMSGYGFLPWLHKRAIRDLAMIMPNLTSLEMMLGSETFAVVCESWPGLRELRIQLEDEYYMWLGDDHLTGFGWKYQSVWEGELEALAKSGRISRKPNISCFKELQHFTLVKDGVEDETLTDFCVYNGLLQLPCLASVNILCARKAGNEAPTYSVFTEAARKRLRAKVPIVNIEFEPALDENPKKFLLANADCLEGTETYW